MKLTIPWDDFKEAAYSKIKEQYPNIIDDDSVEFVTIRSDGQSQIYNIPDAVIIHLEDKPMKHPKTCIYSDDNCHKNLGHRKTGEDCTFI